MSHQFTKRRLILGDLVKVSLGFIVIGLVLFAGTGWFLILTDIFTFNPCN